MRRNRRLQFHAVVGRCRITASQLAHVFTKPKHSSPPQARGCRHTPHRCESSHFLVHLVTSRAQQLTTFSSPVLRSLGLAFFLRLRRWEYSEPPLTLFLSGQFKVFSLNNSGRIPALQRHLGDVMGYRNPVVDIRVPEFVALISIGNSGCLGIKTKSNGTKQTLKSENFLKSGDFLKKSMERVKGIESFNEPLKIRKLLQIKEAFWHA
jgi:hypothetical protein